MTYDENIFSDLYKDTYGFRPRGHEFYDAAPARKQQVWDRLVAELAEQIIINEEIQRDAIVAFEIEIARMIAAGADTRARALNWLADAEGIDWASYLFHGEVEYHFNLPEGYVAAGL